MENLKTWQNIQFLYWFSADIALCGFRGAEKTYKLSKYFQFRSQRLQNLQLENMQFKKIVNKTLKK